MHVAGETTSAAAAAGKYHPLIFFISYIVLMLLSLGDILASITNANISIILKLILVTSLLTNPRMIMIIYKDHK